MYNEFLCDCVLMNTWWLTNLYLNFAFQKHIEFNLDPWESIIASKTGTGASVHSLGPPPAVAPKTTTTITTPRITEVTDDEEPANQEVGQGQKVEDASGSSPDEPDAVQAPSISGGVSGSTENSQMPG